MIRDTEIDATHVPSPMPPAIAHGVGSQSVPDHGDALRERCQKLFGDGILSPSIAS